jgi:hypothetical protein
MYSNILDAAEADYRDKQQQMHDSEQQETWRSINEVHSSALL